MRDVDLVEACMSLSRALWYLEENNVPHGNIRASNVFVADHHEAAFVVRLGDTGMRKRQVVIIILPLIYFCNFLSKRVVSTLFVKDHIFTLAVS